ncbi:MAG: hypothetical protein NT027_17860 [Proteobacteria bacterium]|nr:hypothetical protein [Pseudomonadota bacterium]
MVVILKFTKSKHLIQVAAARTLLWTSAFASQFLSARETSIECDYVVESGDSLSEILFKSGINGQNTQHYLYGPNGWVAKNKASNTHISNWETLQPGAKIKVQIPKSFGQCPSYSSEEPSQSESISPKIDMEEPKQQIETPLLPNETANDHQVPDSNAKVPDQNMLDDKDKPNPDNENLDFTSLTMSRLELSYYRSLAGSNYILLPKITPVEFMAETRSTSIERVRLYAEILPKVSDTLEGESFHIQSTRIQIGKGFGFSLPLSIESEVAPKIGYWKYSSRMPMILDSTKVEATDLEFDRQLDVGYDLNISRSFSYVSMRLTHGRDLTLGLKGRSNNSARGKAYRTNFEVVVPGPRFEIFDVLSRTTISLKFMNEANKISKGDAASSNEFLDLFTTYDINNTSNDSEISSKVNYLGLGIGVIW